MSPILVARRDRVQRSSRCCASWPSLLQVPPPSTSASLQRRPNELAWRCKWVTGIGRLPGTCMTAPPMRVARCRGAPMAIPASPGSEGPWPQRKREPGGRAGRCDQAPVPAAHGVVARPGLDARVVTDSIVNWALRAAPYGCNSVLPGQRRTCRMRGTRAAGRRAALRQHDPH